jgi:hypothetical protein
MIGAAFLNCQYNPRSFWVRLSILDRAARLGIKVTVLASIYNKEPEATTRAALTTLHPSAMIFDRDPDPSNA